MAITKPTHRSRRARRRRSVAVARCSPSLSGSSLAPAPVPRPTRSREAPTHRPQPLGDPRPLSQRPPSTDGAESEATETPGPVRRVPPRRRRRPMESSQRPPRQKAPTVSKTAAALNTAGGSLFQRSAALTVPGQPGTPQAAAVVYAEDFESGLPSSGPRLLNAYTGAPPLSMTYTADPAWLRSCNGYVLAYIDATAPSGWACNTPQLGLDAHHRRCLGPVRRWRRCQRDREPRRRRLHGQQSSGRSQQGAVRDGAHRARHPQPLLHVLRRRGERQLPVSPVRSTRSIS